MKYRKQPLITILSVLLILGSVCSQAGTMNKPINQRNQPTPQAIVFISLAMPELSIKQIIQDAERYEIPVVIRGLYRNSFKETASKIFDLIKESNQGGILINPRWFKQYEIKAVPAVVVSRENRFDVVYGNIHLKKALEVIAERGDLAAVAKKVLEKKGL